MRKKKAHGSKHGVRGGSRRTASRGVSVKARAPSSRGGRRKSSRRWSARVMQHSDALDLESGVFKKRSAKQVALSLKRSAEESERRKTSPFRSAMSMLNFAINRAGATLSPERRRVLELAKVELRKAFHHSGNNGA